MAEHVRLGSSAVILSRPFNRLDANEAGESFEQAVASLRLTEQELALRKPEQVELDKQRTYSLIAGFAKIAKLSA